MSLARSLAISVFSFCFMIEQFFAAVSVNFATFTFMKAKAKTKIANLIKRLKITNAKSDG
jgi:hypothetical protein